MKYENEKMHDFNDSEISFLLKRLFEQMNKPTNQLNNVAKQADD